jgi:hypothetical protein
MKQQINLKEIERKASCALHEDGFDEILVGLSLAIMAFFFLDFRLSIAMIAGCAVQIVLKPACRRQITYPRLGYANLQSSESKAKAYTIIVLAIILVLIGLGLFFVSQISWLLPLYLAVVLAGLTIAGTRRSPSIFDYFIAGLFLCSGFIGLLIVYFGHKPGLATAIQGWALALVLIPLGIIKLVRFLRKYPAVVKEVSDGIVT